MRQSWMSDFFYLCKILLLMSSPIVCLVWLMAQQQHRKPFMQKQLKTQLKYSSKAGAMFSHFFLSLPSTPSPKFICRQAGPSFMWRELNVKQTDWKTESESVIERKENTVKKKWGRKIHAVNLCLIIVHFSLLVRPAEVMVCDDWIVKFKLKLL